MTPQLIKGPAGSGLTSCLIDKLKDLAGRQARTDGILFLTLNKPNMNNIRKNTDLEVDTGMNITTFPRFITDELVLFWPLVLDKCEDISVNQPRPVLIDSLTSHDIMRRIVEKMQLGGAFPGIRATSDSISLEIMHNFSRAVFSLTDYHKIAGVLAEANPGNDPAVYTDMQKALDEYIDILLKNGLLDYGLSMYLYDKYLIDNDLYRRHMINTYRYLFADSLEESVPSMVRFISTFLEDFDEAYLTFSTDGGYTSVLGASPDYALKQLEGRCRVVHPEYTRGCPEDMADLAAALEKNICGGGSVRADTPVRLIECEYKSDMVSAAVGEVKRLAASGCRPGNISLIAPYLDPVTEELLISGLKAQGIPGLALTNTGRLIDQPFIGTVVTLTMLAHPWWDIRPNHSELADTFRVCFDMDPVRASILAGAAESKSSLPHLSRRALIRIGFANNKKYESLLDWLGGYTKEIPIDEFLEKLLWDYLIPLPATRENILSTRMLIDMASGYRKIMEIIRPGQIYGADFITSVKRGIKGMEILKEQPDDAVIIATPFSYLMNPVSSKAQIWLDVSDKDWEDSGVRPLSNPYLFEPGYTGIWNTREEEMRSLRVLCRSTSNLLKRCEGSLTVIDCNLTSGFAEQDGMLVKYLQNTCRMT